MTDRYISKHPKPTPYEREILTIMIEECGEIIQAATKMLRFGGADGYPGTSRTNAGDLSKEIGDLWCMVDMASEIGLVGAGTVSAARSDKRVKVMKFLQESRDQ